MLIEWLKNEILTKATWHNDIPGICICQFEWIGPVNEAVMTFKPNEMRSYQIVSDKIRLFTIELPKFNPKKRHHKDMLDNWMAFSR